MDSLTQPLLTKQSRWFGLEQKWLAIIPIVFIAMIVLVAVILMYA